MLKIFLYIFFKNLWNIAIYNSVLNSFEFILYIICSKDPFFPKEVAYFPSIIFLTH